MDCPVPVHHYGDLNQEKKRQKARKYFQLGFAKLDDLRHDLEAIRELAVQAGELGYWPECIELWRQVLRRRPDFVEAHVNVSSAYWQLGQYDKALNAAQTAIRLDRHSREAAYNLAVSQIMLGRAAEAREVLQTLVSNHTEYLPSRFMLAVTLACIGDTHGSRKIASELLKTKAGNAVPGAFEDISARFRQCGLDKFSDALSKLEEEL
jgi:tetratricopeptide (TPR) repeat protein